MNGRKTNNLRSCRRPYLQQGNRDLHGRSLRDGRRRLHRACGWGGGSRQGYDPDRQRDRPVPRTTLSFVQRKRQPDAEDNDSGDESARDRTDGKSPCLSPRPSPDGYPRGASPFQLKSAAMAMIFTLKEQRTRRTEMKRELNNGFGAIGVYALHQ